MSEPIAELTATGVGYVRAGRAILADVSLTAHAGSAIAVTGPSGSGKSSLLALLAGLERPTSGEVRLAGASLRPGDSATLQRFGLILQGYGLVSVLTAAENVELVLQARGRPAPEVMERARVALDRVGMAEVADHLVEELSGGQQQRVAVARALVAEPDVILADEPTAELDAGNRSMILSLLLDEARRGRIVVLASHDREVADACDRELHLVDGRLQEEVALPAYAESEPADAVPADAGQVEAGPSARVNVPTPVEPVPAPPDSASLPAPERPPPARTPVTARSGWRAPEHHVETEPGPQSDDRASTGSTTGWERPTAE